MYGCTFVDAAEYVKVSAADGVHMDAEAQRKLGNILAEVILKEGK
jgi:lysophospholipase L1-like esterase